jgi:hypothetical protein
MQSQDERDREGFAARKERDGTVKEFSHEEITGKYEGEELDERRAARPPDERFSHLEKKQDELKRDGEKKYDELKTDFDKKHDELKGDVKNLGSQMSDVRAEVSGVVAKINGQEKRFDGQEKLMTETLSIVKKSAERDADRAHLTLTAELDVDRAQKLAKVEVEKEVQLDTIDAKRSEREDQLDKRKKRREAFLRALAFVASGGGIIELLHKLGVLK